MLGEKRKRAIGRSVGSFSIVVGKPCPIAVRSAHAAASLRAILELPRALQ
jgi:hypothetical protein